MSPGMEIDFVAPPFAGHLFPLLELAALLREEGLTSLRVVSTEDAAAAITLCGAEPVELLPGRAHEVWAIADTDARVSLHPLRLYRQFRANMALMTDVANQLRDLWTARRPDLVIADFTIPVAGQVARSLGIPWWTSTPSPCAIESRTGTPSYLGGWMPRSGLTGRARDALGRAVIHLFKLGVGAIFASELRALGFAGVYRDDGTEVVYSDECILGFGMREFEFERDWPAAFHFVGPMTGGPSFPHTTPEVGAGKPAILVTLGTHLPWARDEAAALMEQVAAEMPDCLFHFAMGKASSISNERHWNLHYYGFIPYDRYLAQYSAAVTHAGTGITYACIKAGVPMLVWPQDYDQHDHAARVIERGLGLRLKPRRGDVVAGLGRLLSDERLRARAAEFQQLSTHYDAGAWVMQALREKGWV